VKPSRLEAFSDGVFAVAITLLIFNLKVPDIATGHLGRALGHQWPSYLAYLISFLSIGICWVNHHSILDRVAMADRELLFINLAVLFGIVTIPFTTSLAAIWYKQGNDAKWAIGIYCANWIYVSSTYMLLIHHLMGHAHLSSNATGVTLQSLWRKGAYGFSAYVAATVISVFLPILAFLVCLALAVYYVFGVENEESLESH
jgi:uncharacterized membrane protein